MAKGGKREGAGRKKGVGNKITTDIKQMVLDAFHKVGGASYLAEQASKNPNAFMTLLGKVIPTQVQAEVNAKISHIEVVRKQ